MNRSTKWMGAVALPVLAGLMACGGGGSSAPPTPVTPTTATSLVYTDPASGTYLLKKNVGLSTATHLVLELTGPASNGTGVALGLTVDPAKASWSNVTSGDAANTFVANGSQFVLGSAPQILKAKVTAGDILAAAAQKGTGSPVSLNGALLRVALDLKTGLTPGAVTLSATSAKCQVIDSTSTIVPIVVNVGTLVAQ